MTYPTEPPGRSALRAWLVEVFVFGNLAFLALDVYLAHLTNHFAHAAEWVPIGFSVVAPLLLVGGLIRRRSIVGAGRVSGFAVGAGAILLGGTGMVLHLKSTFFVVQSLHNLVYTAPFAAPLSYVGLGLLLILNRLKAAEERAWGEWVVFMALGGFVGNMALSLADHAQNGFFEPLEWIPVGASAIGIGVLSSIFWTGYGWRYIRLCQVVMVVQVAVGGLGFALHLMADLQAPAASLSARLIYGAPIFAPLLFANIALLALLGLWHLRTAGAPAPAA